MILEEFMLRGVQLYKEKITETSIWSFFGSWEIYTEEKIEFFIVTPTAKHC